MNIRRNRCQGTTQRMDAVQPHKYKLGNKQLYDIFVEKGMEIVSFYKITSFINDIALYT